MAFIHDRSSATCSSGMQAHTSPTQHHLARSRTGCAGRRRLILWNADRVNVRTPRADAAYASSARRSTPIFNCIAEPSWRDFHCVARLGWLRHDASSRRNPAANKEARRILYTYPGADGRRHPQRRRRTRCGRSSIWNWRVTPKNSSSTSMRRILPDSDAGDHRSLVRARDAACATARRRYRTG